MSIRNIAIIAHVDHGKTTLVDNMLRQTGIFRDNQQVQELVMDSNPLERERGITILAKNTAVHWRDVKINIVDTPGHADFGGEVERILRMVDGVVLLVDAAEGPMPQTRFVMRKALDLGLLPVVIINKVDRQDARPAEVHDEVLGLLMELEANHKQFDAPFLYASGREGWAVRGVDEKGADLEPLFETIVDHFLPPLVDRQGQFQMLVYTLDHSPYIGRITIGRIERGSVTVGELVALLPHGEPGMVPEESAEEARVMKLFTYLGLERIDVETAYAGDIVALAGLEGVEIGMTLTDPDHRERMSGIKVEEPTLSVDFNVNNSPFAGQSGKYVTTRQLRERLFRELEKNVSLGVEDTDQPDIYQVSGRGELHLTILMETMRREGYEFQVSRPQVITKKAADGQLLEPFEEAAVEVPSAQVGIVIERLGPRKAELIDMRPMDSGTTRLRFKVPSRGLFGYRSDFMTDTRGEGILHHQFHEYAPWAGGLQSRKRGVLVADREGEVVAYALGGLQERAAMFVKPGDPVYEGMIVGENARSDDMPVNVTKEKKLTNMRTTATDENIKLEPPRQITLELALEFIEEDELIEVTPGGIRLRKRLLDANQRRKADKQKAASR
jgi:GTP-binding protein